MLLLAMVGLGLLQAFTVFEDSRRVGETGIGPWLLMAAFAYPALAGGMALLRAYSRLRALLASSIPIERLPEELAAAMREAAAKLNLPERKLPHVVQPIGGPPMPFVYGLGIGPSVLIYPSTLEVVFETVAVGSREKQDCLRLFIVGHELGHIKHQDISFLCYWREVEPLFRWWCPILLAFYIGVSAVSPLPGLPILLPGLLLQCLFFYLIQGIALSAARQREFAADTVGFSLVGQSPAAAALLQTDETEDSRGLLELAFGTMSDLAVLLPPASGFVLSPAMALGAVSTAAVNEGRNGGDKKGLLSRAAAWMRRSWGETHPELSVRLEQSGGEQFWFAGRHAAFRLVGLMLWHAVVITALVATLDEAHRLHFYLADFQQRPLLGHPRQPGNNFVLLLAVPAVYLLIVPGILSFAGGRRGTEILSRKDAGDPLFGGCLFLLIVLPSLAGILAWGVIHLVEFAEPWWRTIRVENLKYLAFCYSVPIALFLLLVCSVVIQAISSKINWEGTGKGTAQPHRWIIMLGFLAPLPFAQLLAILSTGKLHQRTGDLVVLLAYFVLVSGFSYRIIADPNRWRHVRELIWPE